MPEFKDSEKKVWPVKITVGTVTRVREALKVDIVSLLDDRDLFFRLANDDVLLADVLYVVCKADVPKEQFADLFSGEITAAAREAFWEAHALFIADPEKRRLFRGMIAKVKEMTAAAVIRAEAKMSETTLVTSESGSAAPSGKCEDSLESTPTPLRLAN